MQQEEILIDVQHVSKRFCKDLKRSMRYGFMDSLRAIAGKDATATELRKDEFWAVKDVSFQLKRGECLGLIGHNGAGKSTLLKMLNGLINPDQGSITMRGKIGALIELGAGFNPILTGRENIYNNGAVLGFTRKEIDAKVEAIIDFAEIREFIDSPVQNYSSGMRVRLGFAVAAQMEPDILLIDEVLAVGDIGFMIKCLNRISELTKKCAIIFVSHSMPQITRICTQGILMARGHSELITKDIGLLIENYFFSFEQTQDKSLLQDDDIELNNIKFQNKNTSQDKEVHFIESDDDISVIFKCRIPSRISEFSIHLPVTNMQLQHVAITTSLSSIGFIHNNGEIFNVKLLIPNMFTAGKYYLGITIIENEEHDGNITIGRTLLKFENYICFIVKNTKLTTSVPIQLKSKWEIKNE